MFAMKSMKESAFSSLLIVVILFNALSSMPALAEALDDQQAEACNIARS